MDDAVYADRIILDRELDSYTRETSVEFIIALLGLFGGIVCRVGVKFLQYGGQDAVHYGVHVYYVDVFAVYGSDKCLHFL